MDNIVIPMSCGRLIILALCPNIIYQMGALLSSTSATSQRTPAPAARDFGRILTECMVSIDTYIPFHCIMYTRFKASIVFERI